MPRRRPLLTVSTLVAVNLAVAGCTIPTTKDGGGYGPSGQQAVRKAAQPAPVELRSGAPLLHFPMQAIFLWDFLVYFALERWRAPKRNGGRLGVKQAGDPATGVAAVCRSRGPVEPGGDRQELGHRVTGRDGTAARAAD